MSPLHRRRSVRLRGADYGAPGLYFVTVCAHGRQRLFGDVVEGRMVLSRCGQIAVEAWMETPSVRPSVRLDAFVVMPDHAHLLFGIVGNDVSPPPGVGAYCNTPLRGGTASFRSPSRTVGAIVRGYKGAVTRGIRRLDPAARVWQRSFHDRIVRTEREADAIRAYIRDNPTRWAQRVERADGHRV